jgi:uncharacterized membrane protein
MPEPLHPALVHFPIVLAFLSLIAAAIVLWAMQSGRLSRRAWLAVVILQVAVLGSGWLAAETGEEEEERVERVIAEKHIEEHEEAAERFLAIAGVTLAVSIAGILAGPFGSVARGLTVAAGLASVVLVAAVGHSGGELVYRHGAAAAYTQDESADASGGQSGTAHDEDDDHDDDHDDDDD